jgi:hypothetical protein
VLDLPGHGDSSVPPEDEDLSLFAQTEGKQEFSEKTCGMPLTNFII